MRRRVVKIGSVLLATDGRGLDRNTMAVWVGQMVVLHRAGIELALVPSGAAVAGVNRLGWVPRSSAMRELQAAALVGQMRLVQTWESSFAPCGPQTVRVLPIYDNLSDYRRYLNACSTLRTLAELGMVPVINENNTVVTDEIHFGDNDTLTASVTNLVEADLLVILTDRDSMFDIDPRNNPGTQLIYEACAGDPQLDAVTSDSAGALRRDGMQTKLRATHLAARSGEHTVIVGGYIEHILSRPCAGRRLGILLTPGRSHKTARRQWLTGHLQMYGTLVLGDGTVKAMSQNRKSLLSAGIKAVWGSFRRSRMMVYVDQDGREAACGLVNYSTLEAQKILGQSTGAVETLLGYVDGSELVYRDNLVLV